MTRRPPRGPPCVAADLRFHVAAVVRLDAACAQDKCGSGLAAAWRFLLVSGLGGELRPGKGLVTCTSRAGAVEPRMRACRRGSSGSARPDSVRGDHPTAGDGSRQQEAAGGSRTSDDTRPSFQRAAWPAHDAWFHLSAKFTRLSVGFWRLLMRHEMLPGVVGRGSHQGPGTCGRWVRRGRMGARVRVEAAAGSDWV